MASSGMCRSLTAVLVVLVLVGSVYGAAGSRDAAFGRTEQTLLADQCDPDNTATFRRSCVSTASGTTTADPPVTATIEIIGIVRQTCATLGFSKNALDCNDNPNTVAYHLSMNLHMDEANHQACKIQFVWGVVPDEVNGDRLCSPFKCDTGRATSDVFGCDQIEPLLITIDVPAMTHESVLEADQFTPFDYVILSQGEYFPQSNYHMPVAKTKADLLNRAAFESAYLAGAGTSATRSTHEVWSLIDPNYQTSCSEGGSCAFASHAGFFCSDPAAEYNTGVDHPVGRDECCVRGRIYSASNLDQNGSPSLTALGTTSGLYSNPDFPYVTGTDKNTFNHPLRLESCAADPSNPQDAFAWAHPDTITERESQLLFYYDSGGIDYANNGTVVPSTGSASSVRTLSGYYPTTPPRRALSNYFAADVRQLATMDDRNPATHEPLRKSRPMGIIHEYSAQNDTIDTLYANTAKAVYPIGERVHTYLGSIYNRRPLVDTTPWTRHGRLPDELYRRDARNHPDGESGRLANGAWVPTPMKQPWDGSRQERETYRLRCGYCGSSPTVFNEPCPTLNERNPCKGNVVDCPDTGFDTNSGTRTGQLACPMVATKDGMEVSFDQANNGGGSAALRTTIDATNAFTVESVRTDSLRWSERLHPRAFAESVWVLGTTPMCAAMRPAETITHSKIEVTVTKIQSTVTLPATMDLSISEPNPRYGRVSSNTYVRGDIQTELPQQKSALQDTVYMDAADRVQVCDTYLYDSITMSHDRFAAVASADPFTNPYDGLNATAVGVDGVVSCRGCSPLDQFNGTDPSDNLLWRYILAGDYETEWRTKLPVTKTLSETEAFIQRDIDNVCGKRGMGMELYQLNGCDAVLQNNRTFPRSASGHAMPTSMDSCSNNQDKYPDARNVPREQTCAVPGITVAANDYLGCSRAHANLCIPSSNPVDDWARMVAARNQPTTRTDEQLRNELGWRPDTRLDRPNTWLGRSTLDGHTAHGRSLYYTNDRRDGARLVGPSIRTSRINVYVTSAFAPVRRLVVPCVNSIEFSPCQMSTHEAVPATSAGRFLLQIPVSEPAFDTRNFVLNMVYGDGVSCRLSLSTYASDIGPFNETLVIPISKSSAEIAVISREIEFECTLTDATAPIADDQVGYIYVREGITPLLGIRMPSCDQHTRMVAQCPQNNNVFTPFYANTVRQPCSGISGASNTCGGLLAVDLHIVSDMTDQVLNDPFGSIIVATPTPTPTPTPRANNPTDPTGSDDDLYDNGQGTVGDDRTNVVRTPTPTPTFVLPQRYQDFIEVANSEAEAEKRNNRIGLIVLGSLFSLVVGAVVIGGCLIASTRSGEPKEKEEFDG